MVYSIIIIIIRRYAQYLDLILLHVLLLSYYYSWKLSSSPLNISHYIMILNLRLLLVYEAEVVKLA